MKLLCAILLMTSATILSAVESSLAPLVLADNCGLVSVAEAEEDALQELAQAPERWRVILSMDGDNNLEDLDTGLVEGRLVAFVQAPKGMEPVRNHNVAHESIRGTPAFFTRLHWLIRKVRGLKLVAPDIDAKGFRYRGWEWLRYDGQAAFRTAKANFDLIFAHDDPATDPNGIAAMVLGTFYRIAAAEDVSYDIVLNGAAHGQIQRFLPGTEDNAGSAADFAIADSGADFYAIAFNGALHGRVQRDAAGDGDPRSSVMGYTLTGAADEFYTVALNGAPHGRIPRFLA